MSMLYKMGLSVILMASFSPSIFGLQDELGESRTEVVRERENRERGGLFIEPAVSLGVSNLTLSYPAPFNNSNESMRSAELGLRLGLHTLDIIFLSLDGRLLTSIYESAAMGASGRANGSNAGLTVGVQTPFMGMRLWGTYIFAGDLNPDRMGQVDIKFSNLNGFRLGAALYVAMFSVDLEYQEAKYGTTTVESLGPFSVGELDGINNTQKSVLVSLSFPFAL